jgi:hypothetical protein
MVLLRPLFLTSWFLMEYTQEIMPSGGQIIIVSASSKTAYSFAYLLKHCAPPEVSKFRRVGVTSKANGDFVKSLDIYDNVIFYEDVENELSKPEFQKPGRLFDMSGNTGVLNKIVKSVPGTECILVGGTHTTVQKEKRKVPLSSYFFAPSFYVSYQKKVDAHILSHRIMTDWVKFLTHVHKESWCKVDIRKGISSISEIWKSALTPGGITPNEGIVFSFDSDKSML